MATIEMKFSPENGYMVSTGRKCSTIRLEKKGDIGDEFVHGCEVYRLLRVESALVKTAIMDYYDLEGFWCPGGLRMELLELYPLMSMTDTVWVHVFARCGEVEE